MKTGKLVSRVITGFCLILLLFLVPVLVGVNFLYQWSTPTLDLFLDHPGSSTISSVFAGGEADKAGIIAGDVILSIDDVTFNRWSSPQIGHTHIFLVERRGTTLEVPLKSVRLLQMNVFALTGSSIMALIFWMIGGYLLIRKFWNEEIQLVFLLFQIIPAAILLPLSLQIEWNYPVGMQIVTKIAAILIAPIFLNLTLSHPIRLGKKAQRLSLRIAIFGTLLIITWGWITGRSWGQKAVITYTTLLFSLAFVFLAYSYQYHGSPDSRRRVRVALFCLLTAATPFILSYLIPRSFGSHIYLPGWIACLFFVLAPIGYLFSTLYFNLYGIDRLINRTLVYILLSMGIFAIYLIPYGFFYRFIPSNLFTQLVIIFSLTIWIGWTFDWLRSHAQRFVDRMVYGGWYDFPNVVETISNALARSTTRNQIRIVLTIQVPRMMRLSDSILWIGNKEEPFTSHQSMETSSFRYLFKTDIPAIWTVTSHSDGDDLSAIDHRILNTLAQQAEIALNNALAIEALEYQLNEIRTSREILSHTQRQLLRSREEERSRLARDLHDSPIQALVGMNIQVGLLLRQEGLEEATRQSLSDMRAEIRQLSDELRQICADLRPPMLDALGLSSALHSLAIEWSKQAGIKVKLDLCDDSKTRQLPGEVTVNIYRVAQEALSNISKHARAKLVIINLSLDDARLVMTIEDDGVGFEPPDTLQGLTAHSHFGLAGMRERINLIGGEWAVESLPQKGTIVRVVWEGNRIHNGK